MNYMTLRRVRMYESTPQINMLELLDLKPMAIKP